ncbi:MAG: two-component regulator propeller domain-containing protein [archaeon]
MKMFMLFIVLAAASVSFGQKNWILLNSTNSRLPNNTVYSVIIDDQDIKWIGTGVGFGRYDGTYWNVYNKSNSGLPNNTVRSIAIDSKGNKWLGTDGGLAKFDGMNWTVFTHENSPLPDNAIRAVAVDKQGFIWIGTKNHGVARFDGTLNWLILDNSNSGLPVNDINSLTIDAQNVKWIGTSGGGLVKFDGYNWTIYNKSNSGTACNSFLSIAFDSKGIKWFGTWNGGLEFFNDIYWDSFRPFYTVKDKWVTAVAVDKQDKKWVGFERMGLATYDGKWFIFDSLNSQMPDTCIKSIAVDKHNNKWIGTNTGGLAIYNENGVSMTNITVTAPSGGTKWAAGSRQTVSWYSRDISGNVNIKLSLDGGSTYPVTLASNTANDGTEEITVPSDQSSSCRIKVESASNPEVYSLSPADFSIITIKAPLLLSPADNGAVAPSKIILKWSKVELAEGYVLKVASDAGFSTLLINDPSITDTVRQLTNFSTNLKCYWMVQARSAGGTGPWSEARSFSILPLPSTPALISPGNNALQVSGDAALSWSYAQNAEFYRLNISEDASFSAMFFTDSSLTATSKEIKGLRHGMKYYWQVRGRNAAGSGPYSEVWNFTTKLYSPDSLQAAITSKIVTLTWKDNTNNEAGFTIERKFNSDFGVIGTVGPNQTSFTDSTATQKGNYQYRVKAFTKDAQSDYCAPVIVSVTSVKNTDKGPLTFALEQNYPNPFNPATKIKYSIAKESFVTLRVFNLLGKEVASIVTGRQTTGVYEVSFDGSSLPSGIYLYRLEAGSNIITKKFVLIK